MQSAIGGYMDIYLVAEHFMSDLDVNLSAGSHQLELFFPALTISLEHTHNIDLHYFFVRDDRH